jgi:hypothetical protein
MNFSLQIWRRSACAAAGACAGSFSGFVLALLLIASPGIVLPARDRLSLSLVLAALAWMGLLLMFGVWLRHGVRRSALPALLTALITVTLTVYINAALRQPAVAAIVGMIIGTLVGAALCRACSAYIDSRGALRHG